MEINEWTDDALIDDMVGILLQFGHNGHFVTNVLELWKLTHDYELKQASKLMIGTTVNKFKLDEEYRRILMTIPEARKMSMEFIKSAWNAVEVDQLFDEIYGKAKYPPPSNIY